MAVRLWGEFGNKVWTSGGDLLHLGAWLDTGRGEEAGQGRPLRTVSACPQLTTPLSPVKGWLSTIELGDTGGRQAPLPAHPAETVSSSVGKNPEAGI